MNKYLECLKRYKRMSRFDFQKEFDLSQQHASRIMISLCNLNNQIKKEYVIINKNGKAYLICYIFIK